jgi:hypothetical protein
VEDGDGNAIKFGLGSLSYKKMSHYLLRFFFCKLTIFLLIKRTKTFLMVYLFKNNNGIVRDRDERNC